VWLKPQLVAQIEFTERMPTATFGISTFCGFREDKEPAGVLKE